MSVDPRLSSGREHFFTLSLSQWMVVTGRVPVDTRSKTGRKSFLHSLSPSGCVWPVEEGGFPIDNRSNSGRKSFLHILSPSGYVYPVVWTPLTGRDPVESRSSVCLWHTGRPVGGLLTGRSGMIARSQTGWSPDTATIFFLFNLFFMTLFFDVALIQSCPLKTKVGTLWV